jgi:hypothetical protein
VHQLRLPNDHYFVRTFKRLKGKAFYNFAASFTRYQCLLVFTTIKICPVIKIPERLINKERSPAFQDISLEAVFIFIAFNIAERKDKVGIGVNEF